MHSVSLHRKYRVISHGSQFAGYISGGCPVPDDLDKWYKTLLDVFCHHRPTKVTKQASVKVTRTGKAYPPDSISLNQNHHGLKSPNE